MVNTLIAIPVASGTHYFGTSFCNPNTYSFKVLGGIATIDGDKISFSGGLYGNFNVSLGAAATMNAGDKFYITEVWGI